MPLERRLRRERPDLASEERARALSLTYGLDDNLERFRAFPTTRVGSLARGQDGGEAALGSMDGGGR